MKIRISYINPVQACLVCAFIYLLGSLIMIFLNVTLVPMIGGKVDENWLRTIIVVPVMSLVGGGIAGFIGAILYNLVAKMTGGIECEYQECDTSEETDSN
ncbi:MAG: hypothetical protein LBV12_06180 [Puniceicoccales bacterium]|jgi:hypothetical protein|nr:hypothetical protein [Puniceicoccales bacterium]